MMHPSYTALVFLNVVFAIAMVLTLRAIFSSSGWQTYVGEADVLPDVHHHQPQCVALDGPPARLSPLQLNLFWLMRCRTLPITEWYGNLSGAANATALPMNALRWMGHDQGVLLPLHAMYLSLLGFMYEYAITWQWSGWSNHGSDVALMEAWVKGGKQHGEQPRHHHHHAAAAAPATSAMEALYAHDAPPPTPFYANLGPADEVLLSSSALTYESMLPVVLPLRQVHGFLLAMVVIVAGVHLTWRLCFTVASMLAHAVAAHAEAEIAEDAPTLRSHDARDVLIARSARAGAVVLLLAGVLPTFVLELITLAPACLSTLLVLYAIVLLVELEAEVLCPPSHSLNDAIHLYKTTSAPLGASGNIAFYGLRHRPSAMRMIMAVALSALAAALFRPAAYVAPVMLMWALTLCYQLAHTRVLVCSTTRNTATGELVATPIAYSSVYEARWLHMRLCGVVLALVGAMCCASVPFLYQTQQWSQIPALMNAWMGTRQEVVPSSTSSSSSSPTYEFGATCPGTLTHADAVRVHAQPPSPNAWLLSDLYGYPSWSTILPHVAQKLLHYHNTTHAQEQMCEDSSMWINYLGMVMVVMCSAVPMFALAAYRLRRAPLVFDTPASFAENERRYEAEYARYWQDRSAGKRPPSSSSSSSPATSSAASKVHATSITREEYLVKQIILLMTIALIITTAASIFVLNSSATSYIMIIPIAALLMAVRNIIMKLRNAAPKALFYHDGDASADSSISTYMAETSSDWCRHSTAVLTDNMDDIIIVLAAAAYAHAAAPLLRDVLRPLNVAENVVAWIVVQAWARVVWEMIRGSYKRGHGAWIQWSLALVLMLVAFFVNVPTSAGGSAIVSEIFYGVWPRATAEEVPSSWRQRCTFSASALAPLDASSSIHACISILLGLCVVVLGSRRVLRLAIETEEVSFGSPESELGTFAQRPKSAPSPARRVQRRR